MPTVVWSFEGDTKDLEAALSQVQGSVNDTGKGLKETGEKGQKGFKLTEEGAKKAAKVVGGVLLAGLAAATAASVGLAAAVVSVAKDLDNLAKQAKRAGTTAAELDKIRGVFDLAGVSVGQTDAMVKKFRVNLGKAAIGTAAQADALALLGTKAEDFTRLPLEGKLALVAKGMKGIEDPAIRATVATDLFGRSGLDILPLLEDGEAAWNANSAAITRAGVATDEQAKQSEDLVDALALMDRTLGSLVRDSLVPMIPALIEVAETVADTIQSFDVDRIVRWATALADVTSGAMLAWRALRGLNQEQRQAALLSGEASEAIAKQGEAVEDARRALERWQTVHLGTKKAATLAIQPEMIAKTSAELERQLKIFRRLRGELSADIPGLMASTGGGGPAPTTPSGGGRTGGGGPPGVAAPTPADAAAVDTYAESWDALRGSVEALEDATGAILDKQLSASDRLIQRREEEDAQLVALVNDAVAHTGMGEEQKSQLIAKGTEARRALEQGLYDDLEALRQKDLEDEAAALEEKTSGWEEFLETWNDGLGEMVNAIGNVAQGIVGIFQAMNDDVMDDRISAHQKTAARIEDINEQLLSTIDSAEKTRLEAEKGRLEERSAAQKEAAMEAFHTQKALALVSASISMALAIINALATQPFVLGVVMAVAAGVAGGIAIASIAAEQPPSFHSGGILRASDVKGASMDSIMLRAKPGEGVLSTSGVAAAGGPDGVDALNAGRGGSRGTTVNVIRFGTRTTEAISHQQLQSRTGNMQGALRAVRPKVGRSIPGRR